MPTAQIQPLSLPGSKRPSSQSQLGWRKRSGVFSEWRQCSITPVSTPPPLRWLIASCQLCFSFYLKGNINIKGDDGKIYIYIPPLGWKQSWCGGVVGWNIKGIHALALAPVPRMLGLSAQNSGNTNNILWLKSQPPGLSLHQSLLPRVSGSKPLLLRLLDPLPQSQYIPLVKMAIIIQKCTNIHNYTAVLWDPDVLQDGTPNFYNYRS